jgi:hypothetical protein
VSSEFFFPVNCSPEPYTAPRLARMHTSVDAYYRLGRIYLAAGQKEKAEQEFAMTKKLHSKAADSLIQKVSGDSPAMHL